MLRHFSLFLLRLFSQIIVLVGLVVFFYGTYRFYDGPIVAQYGAYYGMRGQPRSAADYHAFKHWETAICVFWPTMFALCGLRLWLDPKGLTWVWSWKRTNETI
jgi:hypothetical protein